jgi:hypothetical protein
MLRISFRGNVWELGGVRFYWEPIGKEYYTKVDGVKVSLFATRKGYGDKKPVYAFFIGMDYAWLNEQEVAEFLT